MNKLMIGVNEHGLRVGEDHQRAHLTDHEVDQLRELHEEHCACYRDLADWFGCPKSTVASICQYSRRVQTAVAFRVLKPRVRIP